MRQVGGEDRRFDAVRADRLGQRRIGLARAMRVEREIVARRREPRGDRRADAMEPARDEREHQRRSRTRVMPIDSPACDSASLTILTSTRVTRASPPKIVSTI